MPSKLGSEFKVNTFTTNGQEAPCIAVLNTGNFVVVWQSGGQDGSGYGVYGQVFTADGSKVGNEFQVNTYISNHQQNPTIAALSNGNFVVVWQGQDGAGYYDVSGQVFTGSGSKVGSEFLVNTYKTNDQFYPSIAVLSNGNFVIAWQSFGQDGSSYGVYGQVFTADGSKVGNEFQVNTYTTNGQEAPCIAVLNTGNFVVAWQSNGQDGSGYGVYGHLFTADGSKVGNEFLLNTYATDNQQNPRIVVLSNGNFLVVWSSNLQDGSGYGVYGQVFTAGGSKVGNEFKLNTYTNNNQQNPSIAVLSNGNFLVVWSSNLQDGSGYGVYGQVFTAGGSKVGNEFLVNTYTANDQQNPTIAALSNGNFVVVWQSNYQDGSGYGVYGQVFYGQIVANNVDQPLLSYTEETTRAISNLSISGALNENAVTVTLALSPAASGSLSTATFGNVTSTYNGGTGVWQASGNFQDINNLLAGLVFTPTANGNQNVTITVTINDGISTTVTGTWNLAGIPVNDMPVLVNNQLIVSEGQSVIVTNVNLSATDVDVPAGTLTFTISNLQGGRFELTSNPGVSVTSFTQQQITNGEVRFVHDGGELAPTYQVSVSDNSLSTPPVSANVTFTPVNDMPVLVNNQLTVSEGQSVIVTNANLSATDMDNSAGSLIFTISNLQAGHFELTSNPGIPITSFTQQQITNGDICFVHDGSELAPAYQVSVSDGSVSTIPISANIAYIPINNHAPVLSNYQLTIKQGQSIILTSTDLSATDADLPPNPLTFTVINVQHGRFELTSNPGLAISSFTPEQIANGEVRFVQDGSDNAPAYQVSVSDGTFNTSFFPATITFIKNQAPVVTNPIPDQIVQLNYPFSFQIASDTFSDPDGDSLTYTAARSDSSGLPSWLQFNGVTRFFSGASNQTGILPMNVTASDPYGLKASTAFNISVQNALPLRSDTDSGVNGRLVGGIIGGLAAGGLAGAAYLAYQRGFFTSLSRNRNNDNDPTNSYVDTDIELPKKRSFLQ